MSENESEFGKGFIYNLILFAKHHGKIMDMVKRYNQAELPDVWEMWFNSAGDHWYELEVPSQWQEHEIGRRVVVLKDRILHLRLAWGGRPPATEDDFNQVWVEIEDIARLIDKELGVDDIKASWN